MPQSPTLEPSAKKSRAMATAAPHDSVVLAVYAPFGTDEILSLYPNATQAAVKQQNLVRALQRVAAEGANVSCLIDLFEDNSYLVEIPAFNPAGMTITSVWKQDMSAPQALAGFLTRVRDRFPCSTIVLALEGHGGAFVPDIDRARFKPDFTNQWAGGKLRWIKSLDQTRVEPESGPVPLPMGYPELPMGYPELPASRMPLSTWALGEALRLAAQAKVSRPAVIHFNNCFNGSVEVLHTVAPYADYATGYANYDFFTAGDAYPKVFRNLRLAGTASRLQLAQWFALENRAQLATLPGYPTVGATVPLAKMRTTVASAIDKLSTALIDSLAPATRAANLPKIKQAAIDGQHYDTVPGFELAVPDQFIDIGSFAAKLQKQFAAGSAVNAAAAALQSALAGFYVYGDNAPAKLGSAPFPTYDFSAKDLGLNIFFPDPALEGVWDWRSPYYVAGKVDLTQPPPQRHVIDFLAEVGGKRPRWVEFIVEYHRETKFVGFHAIQPLVFPLFNPRGPNTGPGNPTTGAAGPKPPRTPRK